MTHVSLALLLLLLLQIKHLAADFMLQTGYMLNNRRHYGHPGGLLHVAIHAALSALVFLIVPTPIAVALIIIVAEALIHYHIDWAKDNFSYSRNLSPDAKGYWVAIGIDQALHQMTYLAMVWVWYTVTH